MRARRPINNEVSGWVLLEWNHLNHPFYTEYSAIVTILS